MGIKDIRQHPEETFHHPDDVVQSNKLTLEQKLSILHQWKDELEQETRASDEGMPGSDHSALLQAIMQAIVVLSE